MKSFVIGAAWVSLGAAIATGSYMLKNHVMFLEAELRDTNRQTVKNIKETHVLKAEWSHLNDPSRIKGLAEKYTKLQTLKAAQFVRVEDIPFKEGEK